MIFCDAVASGADIYLPVQFSNDMLYVLKRLYLIKDFGRKGFSYKDTDKKYISDIKFIEKCVIRVKCNDIIRIVCSSEFDREYNNRLRNIKDYGLLGYYLTDDVLSFMYGSHFSLTRCNKKIREDMRKIEEHKRKRLNFSKWFFDNYVRPFSMDKCVRFFIFATSCCLISFIGLILFFCTFVYPKYSFYSSGECCSK